MRLAGQVSASHGRGTVVVITGAKGGIGKSVLAVNLALSLRQKSNRPVVVLDADDQFGDIATMLDLTPASTFEDLARKVDGFNRDTVQSYVTPHASGIDVIAGSPTEDVFDRMDPAGLAERTHGYGYRTSGRGKNRHPKWSLVVQVPPASRSMKKPVG